MTTVVLASASTVPSQAAEVQTPWRFGGIGPSQSTLRIITDVGCSRPIPPLVEETPSAVRITARNREPDVRPVCPAIIGFVPVYVHLAAPLAGRRLSGAVGQIRRSSPRSSPPRVVGLSPGDAVTVLQAAGAAPKIVGRRTATGLRRVVAQRGARLVVGGSGQPST